MADLERKLSAILSADVAGYSRLMAQDEEATVRTLTLYRDLISRMVQGHRGRVVDSPGDNLLAEFASAVEAVGCAVEIQRELKVRNAELPQERRMAFRIGINLGDVIAQDQRLYGDGVNVASRIEGLAEPGGVSISGSIHEQVRNRLKLVFRDQGEHLVKNIAAPVRVFRVEMGVAPALDKQPEVSALPLPEKPSIAVMPFVNMSSDPEQEYFSDGISEDIITGLAHIPKLFVIARNSSFSYKAQAVKVQQVGRELGVRYVLEGSVRKAGDRVRITAQLIDAADGRHLWADRWDRVLQDIFQVQDEIVQKILMALQIKLTDGEQTWLLRSMAKSRNIEAYLLLLKGLDHLHRYTKESNVQARRLLQEALAEDPHQVAAMTSMAYTYLLDISIGWTTNAADSFARAEELAKEALKLGPDWDLSHAMMGAIHLFNRQYDQAIAEGERAVELSPSGADAHVWLAAVLGFIGRHTESINLLQRAIRLNPVPPGCYLHLLAMAYSEAGRYDEAIAASRKVLQIQPDAVTARLSLVKDFSLAGRMDEARAAAEEFLRLNPGFSLDGFAASLPHKDPGRKERIIEAMQKAGLK